MSEPVQFGYHPDADQISAFVEQALPVHERVRMLDHLAVCPECRAVVALSLPEVEEPARPTAAAVRKPWWASWTLVWPLAGALAAGILLVAYIRHGAIAPNAPEQQVAVAHSAAPPASQEQSVNRITKAAPRDTQTPRAQGQPASTGAAAIAPESIREAPSAGQSVGGPVLAGRNVDALRQQAEAPNLAAKKQMPATRFSAGPGRGLSGAVSGSIAKTPSATARNRTEEMNSPPPPGTVNPSAQMAKAAAPEPTASEAVTVKNEAPIQTTSADAANIEIAQDETQQTQPKRPLPSHLAVLSIATQLRRMVAIDTNHAVFVSKDAGKHWKAIQAPWQGSAVKASLVQYGSAARSPLSFSSGVIAGLSPANSTSSTQNTNGAMVAQTSPSAAKASRLSGTVADMTGAAVAGASVSVTEIATGTARTVRADSTGRYIVDGLAPGDYRVEAQSSGFKKQQLDRVAVAASAPSIANLSLTIGEATQTVTVQAASDSIITSEEASKKSQESKQSAPVFEVVTDNGDRWTSADGVTWRHK